MKHTETRVTLLNRDHISVGEGYLSTLEEGDVLHMCALQGDEVGVYVTNILNKKYAVDEPFLEFLEECANTFIRWKHEYVVYRGRDTVEEVQRKSAADETCFRVFEWTEEGEERATHRDSSSPQWRMPTGLENIQGTSGEIEAPKTRNAGIHSTTRQSQGQHGMQHMEEPHVSEKKRIYRKKSRGPSHRPLQCKIGEDRVEKVSLQSVRRWNTTTLCIAQCLLNIKETEILDVRYDVWANHTLVDDRVTWILRQMRTFMETNAATGWIDFKFRVAGTPICSACYAHALGYSRRQLERWKDDIRMKDRRSACHGNALKPHETNHIAAACAILHKYIKGCGCTQPHCQHYRKRDGLFIPLVLLPMNTKKKDVQGLVNQSLIEAGEKEISVLAFHAMWRTSFLHVQIPRTSRFSKCSVYWEFTSTLEKIVSNTLKDRLKATYQRHHELQRQE
jgi:hypothetical protein